MSSRILPLLVLTSFLLTSCGGGGEKKKEKPNSKPSTKKSDPKSTTKKSKTVLAPKPGKPQVKKAIFGKTADGTEIDLYTCSNSNGLLFQITNWGATIIRVETPDKDNNLANITLSFPALKGYENNPTYFGCTVGRYCNRIAKGEFKLDGKKYALPKNNGDHHLHGGPKGFHLAVWKLKETINKDGEVGVTMTYKSKDGEQGYPGNVDVTARYTLNDNNELKMVFLAKTDKPTHVNLTNHCYWNLAGERSGTTLDHEVTIHADKFLPVDKTLIPTGKYADYKQSPELDFTKPKAIGKDIKKIKADPQGYDHCYSLRSQDGKLALAAKVKDPKTGRVMEILTTQPGIQFYSGNFLDGSEKVQGFKQYTGFCLETQHYPDTPNQPEFPTTLLKPGETFQQTTVHRFSVEK